MLEFECRQLKETDWDMLVSWWKWWRWPEMPKDMLPENGTGGFLVSKNGIPIVAGFIYTSNSRLAFIDWIVSNPEYKDKNRKQAIATLISMAEEAFKASGYKYMITFGRNKSLIDTHKELGYHIDNKQSHELIKIL
jgi:hypothetical protein